MLFTSIDALIPETLTPLIANDGQTTAEYGMLLGIIAIVIVVLVLIVGSEISGLFVSVLHYL